MTGERAQLNVTIRRVLLDRSESLDPSLVSAEIAEALAQSLASPSSASQRPGGSLGGYIGEAIAAQLNSRDVSPGRPAGQPIPGPAWTMTGGDHGQ